MFKIEQRKSFKKMDNLGRPDWNLHFLSMTFMIANRSFDTSSKCGCIATRDKLILSSGFNGPPAGSLDIKVPIDVRPDKYWYMEHAERNCIYNATKIGVDLSGCSFYVTGIPCIDCMRGMLCLRPKEIIYLTGKNKTIMHDYKHTVAGDGLPVETYLCRVAPNTNIIEYSGKSTTQIIEYLHTVQQNTANKLLLGSVNNG